jgi:hypothetical protein
MNGRAVGVYDELGMPQNGNEVSGNQGGDWRLVAEVS